MAKAETVTLNFDDIAVKRQFMGHVGTLKGLYDVTLKQRKLTRSLSQNRFYWAAYIPFWHEWLKETSGEPWITKEQAHKVLVKHILGTKQIVNQKTGEVIDEIIPDTHTMKTDEFAEYMERAADFMATFCDIALVSPETFVQPVTKPPNKSRAEAA